MRQFDVFTPADFASADFAQLFTCVVIVQFSSATTSLGTLQRLGASWGRDGRSIAWSNAAGATAELNVAKSGSTHFDAFLTLSEPDHALDYAERRIPETRVMQASTDPLDAARTITVFLETTTAN